MSDPWSKSGSDKTRFPVHGLNIHAKVRLLFHDAKKALFDSEHQSHAGLGNFTKAVGKGMGNPCFRIFQTHFASESNIGDVAAKEQVCTIICPACRATKTLLRLLRSVHRALLGFACCHVQARFGK